MHWNMLGNAFTGWIQVSRVGDVRHSENLALIQATVVQYIAECTLILLHYFVSVKNSGPDHVINPAFLCDCMCGVDDGRQ
jgi:hypothetical protein